MKPGAWRRVMTRLGRYPVVRQYDRSDCGPAALLSLLRFHGGEASLAWIRDRAGTAASGSTLAQLASAASDMGCDAHGATGEFADLREVARPCIAHVIRPDGLHHYVVVYETTETSVVVGDPAVGQVRLSREEFEELWRTRVVLLLEPRADLVRQVDPSWVRWLAAHVMHEQTWFFQAIFVGALYTALGLLTAVFVQRLLDVYIPQRDGRGIVIVGSSLLLLVAIRATLAYTRQRFATALNLRIGRRVNREFFTRIVALPARFFDSRRTGDITSRLHDSLSVQSALMRTVGGTIIDVIVMIGATALLFYFSPPLAWLSVVALPVYFLLLIEPSRNTFVQQRAALASYGRLEASCLETVQGMSEIRAYRAGPLFARSSMRGAMEFMRHNERLGVLHSEMGATAELVGGTVILLGLMYSAYLVVTQHLLIGQMMGAYSLLAMLIPTVNRLIEAAIALQGAGAGAQRLRDVLLSPAEATSAGASAPVTGLSIRGGAFAWPSGEVCLRDVDFDLRPGGVTALLGANGAGKSTLVRILRRDLELGAGTLFAGAHVASELALDDYRRQVVVLPEHATMFTGSIAHNIALGRAGVTPERIVERIHAFGLEGMFAAYPYGLATLVGENGRTLSTGERQVVALLRALAEEPGVLIIDEGLNALDIRTLSRVLAGVRAYAETHAVLLITHSLQLLQAADEVLEITADRTIIASDAMTPARYSPAGPNFSFATHTFTAGAA